MNFKPLEEWDNLDIFEYMEEHQRQVWKANGVDPENSPYARLNAARNKILREYYQKEREQKEAAAWAKREAELEEEALTNYVISFKSNVKGGSK